MSKESVNSEEYTMVEIPEAPEDAIVNIQPIPETKDKNVMNGVEKTTLNEIRDDVKIVPDDEEKQPRSHYRRGSAVLAFLKNKIDEDPENTSARDLKLYHTLKKIYDKNLISKHTMIGINVFKNKDLHDPFSVKHMPIEVQIGFRKKLYGLLFLQLLLASCFVLFLTYIPFFYNGMENIFFNSSWLNVLFAGFGLCFTLGLLWFSKYSYPYNFLCLFFFTIMQSFFTSGLVIYLEVDKFIAIYSIFSIALIILIVRALVCTSVTHHGKRLLMSHTRAGFLAYLVVMILSIVFYHLGGDKHVTSGSLLCMLISCFLLTLWFTYDASCLNVKMSPDEYLQGVVLFYSDFVLFMIFLGITVALCAAMETVSVVLASCRCCTLSAGQRSMAEDLEK